MRIRCVHSSFKNTSRHIATRYAPWPHAGTCALDAHGSHAVAWSVAKSVVDDLMDAASCSFGTTISIPILDGISEICNQWDTPMERCVSLYLTPGIPTPRSFMRNSFAFVVVSNDWTRHLTSARAAQ